MNIFETLAGIGWLLSICEVVAMLSLRSFLAVVGVPIARRWLPYTGPAQLVGGPLRFTVEGIDCRSLGGSKLLYRTIPPLLSFKVATPFPLKAVLLLEQGRAELRGSLPAGPILFIAGWVGEAVLSSDVVMALFGVVVAAFCIFAECARAIGQAERLLAALGRDWASR